MGRGGIVKDSKIHKDLCLDFTDWIKKNFEPKFCKMIESPIKGQEIKNSYFTLVFFSYLFFF